MSESRYIIHNETPGITLGVYDGITDNGILYALDREGRRAALNTLPDFSDHEHGLCVISRDGLFGYADLLSGRIAIEPRWERAYAFYGKAAISASRSGKKAPTARSAA